MAKMSIEQPHQLEHAEVKARLDQLQARLANKYGIQGHWTGENDAVVKGTGVKGTISCDASRVRVTLDLSFPISLMKDRIENRVRQELAKVLVPAGAEPATVDTDDDSDGKVDGAAGSATAAAPVEAASDASSDGDGQGDDDGSDGASASDGTGNKVT